MDAPLISVVMPVHSVPARFLDPAVASILAQTERHFELLIVNDHSTDDTAVRAGNWQWRDGRVRLLESATRGIVGALNTGLAAARGEFIARMDGDDVAQPKRFALELEYLQAHPDCACVGTDVLLVDPDDLPLARLWQEADHDRIVERLLSGIGGAICHPTCMMRRAAVERVGGYQAEFEWSEDLDLFLRLADVGRLANLPYVLLAYRQHLQSMNVLKVSRQWENKQVLTARARLQRGLPPLEWTKGKLTPPSPGILYFRWSRMAFRAGFRATGWKCLRKTLLRLPLELPTWCIFAAGYLKRALLRRFAGRQFIPRPRLGSVEAPPLQEQRQAA